MLDRYFYSLEGNADGEKVIHLSSYIYENDGRGDAEDHFRVAEWTSLLIPVDKAKQMMEDDEFYDYVDERVNYLGNLTEKEAKELCETYHDGQAGTELHISEITDDTPCGDYWF
jgi:hypothetical protein